MINKVNGNGVSRAVFDYIYENGGVSFDRALSDLIDCGYKKTSVSSLISQMVTQEMVAKVDGHLYARISEYQPLKSAKKKHSRRPVVKALAIVAKEKPDAPVVRMTSAKVLETMSVKEAHALYLELLTMFGDAK